MASQETSIFIQANGSPGTAQVPRASISGRPLLRSSTSSNPKTTTTMMCSERMSKLVCGAVTIVIVMAVIIVVFVLAFTIDPNLSKNPCRIRPDNYTSIATSSLHHHEECSNKLLLLNDCQLANHMAWIIVNEDSKDFQSAKQLVPEQHKEVYSSILISPPFRISKDVCSLRISLNLDTNTSFHVYLDVKRKHYPINMTSGPCQYGEIRNLSITSLLTERFHFIALARAKLSTNNKAYGLLSTHHCTKYRRYQATDYPPPEVTENPNFKPVERGVRNLCSSEIHQGEKVVCDWMGVQRIGNSNFERVDSHGCLNKGVSHRENDGMVWYFGLPANHPITDAYLISPIMEAGGSSRLVLSFWYRSQCNDSSIRVYLLKSYKDIQGGIPRDLSHVREINSTSKPFNTEFKKVWKFAYYDIAVPTSYKTFQVLIQGVCHQTTCSSKDPPFNCRKYKCKHSNVYNSILGIDEIGIEMRYEQCRPTNGHELANINCSFQDNNNNATTCSWNTTEDFYNFLPVGVEFRHWMPINKVEEGNRHFPANPEHFIGQGHVLFFDASGKSGSRHHWFRSPVVVGNHECSCIMSFLYLVRGIFAPTLSINMVVGSDVNDLHRETLPQWSVHGHQNDSWVRTSFLLNLPSVPFQFEVRVTDLKDTRGDVFVDDIVFSGCGQGQWCYTWGNCQAIIRYAFGDCCSG